MPESSHIQNSQPGPPDQASPDTDDMLVRDCIEWKRTAQRRFYERYAPGVFNVIKRYVFDDAQAQEILNDTFYKVFTRLGQYSAKGPIEAWIRRIAVNTITDHLRKYIRHEKQGVSELNEDDAWIESTAISNLSFAELIGYTGQLSDIQRAIFNLHVFESLTHKEIGALLGISAGNSRWILGDARNKLKQIISSMK